jgi:hypothetical protein
LLPFFFFVHLFSLATVAFWNGQSISTVLQDVVQIEDDVSLPHPPGTPHNRGIFSINETLNFDIIGHFGYLTSNSSTQDECDDSFGSNTSIIEDSDDSILLTPRESTFSSVIIFTSDFNDQLPDTWSEFGSEVASPYLLKDGRNVLDSPPLCVEDVSGTVLAVGSTMNLNLTEQRELISTLAIGTSGLAGVHKATYAIPVVIVTSVSDEYLSATWDIGLDNHTAGLYEVEHDGPIFSDLLGIPAPSWSVNPGLVRAEWQSDESTPPSMNCDVSSCSSASDTSEEPDELDLTEEEEAILETLCIQVPDIVPTVEELAENPHVPVYVPVFSRHNVNNKTVFPIRKPAPPSPEPSRRRLSALSENVNSMFNQVSTSWNRTKAELKRPERTNSIGSMLSSKFAESRNAKAFNRQTQEPLLGTLERDPYDSWPWIRTAVETEDESVDEDLEEEDSFETVFKSALGYLKV